MRLIRTVLVLAALSLTAGCGSSTGTDLSPAGTDLPPASTDLPPAQLPLTLETTGGVAGVHDTLVVDSTGAWTFTDEKNGATHTGQLTDDQLAEVRRLLADPGLVNVPAEEDQVCADFFHYELRAEHRTVSNGPCGEASPAFESLISYLHEVAGSD